MNRLFALTNLFFVGDGEPHGPGEDTGWVIAGVSAFAALDLVGFANDDILLGDAMGFATEAGGTNTFSSSIFRLFARVPVSGGPTPNRNDVLRPSVWPA